MRPRHPSRGRIHDGARVRFGGSPRIGGLTLVERSVLLADRLGLGPVVVWGTGDPAAGWLDRLHRRGVEPRLVDPSAAPLSGVPVGDGVVVIAPDVLFSESALAAVVDRATAAPDVGIAAGAPTFLVYVPPRVVPQLRHSWLFDDVARYLRACPAVDVPTLPRHFARAIAKHDDVRQVEREYVRHLNGKGEGLLHEEDSQGVGAAHVPAGSVRRPPGRGHPRRADTRGDLGVVSGAGHVSNGPHGGCALLRQHGVRLHGWRDRSSDLPRQLVRRMVRDHRRLHHVFLLARGLGRCESVSARGGRLPSRDCARARWFADSGRAHELLAAPGRRRRPGRVRCGFGPGAILVDPRPPVCSLGSPVDQAQHDRAPDRGARARQPDAVAAVPVGIWGHRGHGSSS